MVFGVSQLLVKVLKTHEFFGLLGEQTIYLLAFELIKLKKFAAGSIITSQSKRSPLNYQYKELFENRTVKAQTE